MTKPNDESWVLLLEACSKTARGRCYSEEIITNLKVSGEMTKECWDRLLELKVLGKEPYEEALLDMCNAGAQPDEETLLMMMTAFRSNSDIDGILQLYRTMTAAETQRRSIRSIALEGVGEAALDGREDKLSDQERLGLLLPPPTRRVSLCVLEALRDEKKGSIAVAVLRDMCQRAKLVKERSIRERPLDERTNISSEEKKKLTFESVALTISGRDILTALQAPDVTAFALTIEACVASNMTASALTVLTEMEQWGLYPDRRVYTALMRAFGQRGDVGSALGVFQEMWVNGLVPDTAALQSILDVCLERKDPLEYAQVQHKH